MIKFHFNDDFLQQTVCNILISKNFLFTQGNNEKFFTIIHVSDETSVLSIKINNDICRLQKPINFDMFFQTILNMLTNYKITLNEMIFYPFKQKLFYKNKKIYLNDIHNKIFCYLYLYKDDGVDKYFIYKKIWPNDKQLFINKLDSHLSNVKNEIQENLNFNFDYSSKKKLIKLITN